MDSEDITRIVGAAAIVLLAAYFIRQRLRHIRSGKDRRQLRLLRVSAAVLAQDRGTLLFGLLALAVCVAPLCTLPLWIGWILTNTSLSGHTWGCAIGTVAGFVFLLVGALMSVGIVACVLKRLQGLQPALADGWDAIRLHAGSILFWAWHAARRRREDIPSTVSDLLVIPVLLVERLPLHLAIGRAQELSDRHFQGQASMDLDEMVRTTALGILTLCLFAAIGVFVLPVFSMTMLGREFDLLPSGQSQYLALFKVLALPVGLGLTAACFVALSNIVHATAKYLHVAGSADARAAVLRHFPRDCL